MKEHVFALDIGTHSVTGIIVKKEQSTYRIIDYCIKHHPDRTMLDGQIHDVVQVAKVISHVKEKLETKHGPLKKVCVAAAGRALKTMQAEKTVSLEEHPIKTDEEVKHLELSAVQHALSELTEKHKNQFSHYHCVGYSVLHYKLDGEKIGSFIDQVGQEASVEVIATFLPKIVVESLRRALERADLEMEALTLEPIAAIHVLVPESMRRLNVALIDIGAGTSDIAITKNGTVSAYGMVAVAGDEITEAISDVYLLDFKVAEEIKREIVNNEKATFQDILGNESILTYEELVREISERVEQLAQLLAQEIRLLNGKEPQAVMLIGGGSLTPEINEKISHYLQLPTNRVAIRGIEAIPSLKNKEKLPTGPDFVTPIGIAISATEKPLHYITVYVNDNMTFMFETKQLTVGDALIHAGIEINKYYGKIGLAKIINLNGENRTLRGERGKPPTIYINGEQGTVDHPVQPNDRIEIVKGDDGKHAFYSLDDLTGSIEPIPFYYNEKEYLLQPTYVVNGLKKNKDYIVEDKDHIVIQKEETINDFFKMMDENVRFDSTPFTVFVNNEEVRISKGSSQLLLNGEPAPLSACIKKGDRLTIERAEQVTVNTLLKKLEKPLIYSCIVSFNGESITLVQPQVEVERDGKILDGDKKLEDGDILTMTEKNIRPFIFQDIFRYVDIHPEKRKNYTLYRNGKRSNFQEEIQEGDQLEIIWE